MYGAQALRAPTAAPYHSSASGGCAILYSMVFLFGQPLDEGLVRQIIGVCIGAAVSGIVILIGFVQVIRRITDKEIPARLASIDNRFESLDRHVSDIGKELIQMRRDLDRHGYQIEMLEDWKRSGNGGLDDTRTGSRSRARKPE